MGLHWLPSMINDIQWMKLQNLSNGALRFSFSKLSTSGCVGMLWMKNDGIHQIQCRINGR